MKRVQSPAGQWIALGAMGRGYGARCACAQNNDDEIVRPRRNPSLSVITTSAPWSWSNAAWPASCRTGQGDDECRVAACDALRAGQVFDCAQLSR